MVDIVEAELSRPEHAAAVVQLMDEYARDPMGGGEPLPVMVKENLVRELAKRPNLHQFLAFDGDVPAGLINCFEGFSTFACRPLLNIHDVIVSAAYRGQGLGRLLLQAAETRAMELGCCKLTLEVLEGNTVAQAAYKAFGFSGYALTPTTGKALFWEKKLSTPP